MLDGKIQNYAVRFMTLLCIFLVSANTSYASERNVVISKINTEYYCDDLESVVNSVIAVDVSLDDDEYLKKVFECLDEHSKYYTKEEYKTDILTDSTNMISASIFKNEIDVKITRFGEGIELMLFEYIQKCKARNIDKLVLDLTECPGGYVHVMNEIANEIMPKGKIMTAKFKDNEQVYYSDLENCPFDEITVKVSSQTASAAEILAAGLQEAGVATVIGVNTYGKTSIQSLYKLENGGAFKLTCGEYLTRSDKDISQIGVIPDVVDYSYPVKIRWNDYCKDIIRNNKAVSK